MNPLHISTGENTGLQCEKVKKRGDVIVVTLTGLAGFVARVGDMPWALKRRAR